jgi:hypothetical protein
MPTYWHSVSAVDIPIQAPTDGQINQTLYMHETFPVSSAGTYTYYLVGYMNTGQSAQDYFWYSHMRGVWYPYPIVRDSDQPDEELVTKLQAMGR